MHVGRSGAPGSATGPVSIEAPIAEIEKALNRDDIGAAAGAFASLPDAAKAEAKAFGATLSGLESARRASAALLTSAVPGLGHTKN